MQSSNLGRSLYRRILRELKATRNYDHHLRDIRFLLWVPGTQGKRKFDALKQLAEKTQSLHPRRVKRFAAAAAAAAAAESSAADVVESSSEGKSSKQQQQQSTTSTPVATAAPEEVEPKNPNPTIADQIRAVARELFNHNARMQAKLLPPPQPLAELSAAARAESAAKRVKMLQEGTARAFWAIKRLQDVRAGVVPTASMWLTMGSSSKGSSGGVFDPFTSPRETHLRHGAFPFLPEFLGVDENLVLASDEEEEEAVISAAVDRLDTASRCASKALRLEVVARCAAREGPSARYHVSFRVENISPDAAVDVKLAHLFAVKCESPPVLTEMVCLLPLLGNSILRPAAPNVDTSVPFSFSVSSALDDDDEDDEDGDSEDEEEESDDDDVDQEGGKDDGADEDDDEDAKPQPGVSGTTGSLRPTSHQQQYQQDSFTAKAATPDHCAVYDVSLPVQGECVLRGVVFYRVITNSVVAPPPPSSSAASSSGQQQQPPGAVPTTVKSRLKALHFPPIKLSSESDE